MDISEAIKSILPGKKSTILFLILSSVKSPFICTKFLIGSISFKSIEIILDLLKFKFANSFADLFLLLFGNAEDSKFHYIDIIDEIKSLELLSEPTIEFASPSISRKVSLPLK